MASDADQGAELLTAVREALAASNPLRIRGGDSKACYGNPVDGLELDVRGHRGVVNYDPSELVITARCGTPLREIQGLLAEAGQMLPFEPPDFTGTATIGGAFATGLSGSRRPWAGSARDVVLGVRLINGHGEHDRYGGEVMKNVAGYDVSRMVTGALGTLGVITEVSMKVLPAPRMERTQLLEADSQSAMERVEQSFRRGHPVSAASWCEGVLRLRYSGAESAVLAAAEAVGGERVEAAAQWWANLIDHRLTWFDAPPEQALWRIVVPPLAPELGLGGSELHDWNGQLRWYRGTSDSSTLRKRVHALGGHANVFRRPRVPDVDAGVAVFDGLDPVTKRLNQRLKAAFDPAGIFNRGRMYTDL
jgi:glycolate oxidase FAD binding subunit